MNVQPDDMVVVVRNTFGIPCVEADRGHIFKLDAFGVSIVGPVWRRVGVCPRCGDERWYPDADLQPLPGLGSGDAEKDAEPIDVREVAHG